MNGRYKVYLITIDQSDQHWYYLNQGASDMARIIGLNYSWVAPETKNTQEQIQLVRNAVENGANAILLAASDPIALSSVIEEAKAKSIYIIYVDSPAYEDAVTTLATDNYDAGIKAGEEMIFELENVGILSGSIGIIGVNTTTLSTLDRERGFREVLEADGRFTLLPTVYANGNPALSQEAAERMLQTNNDIVALLGTNEGATIGVGNAIEASSKKVIGLGFDVSDEILAQLRAGNLKFVIAQNAFTMGYLGVAQAYAAIRGYDTGPSYLNTGVRIIRGR